MARRPTAPGFRFNMKNPEAEGRIGSTAGRLVSNLRKETRETVRETVLDGYRRGLHPNSIALDIAGRVGSSGKRTGGIVGMSRPQAEAARSFRERLESGDPAEMSKVLDMKLRDKRFDGTIERAIGEARESGEPASLDEEKIERMVDRYVDASLQLRGETIARTETGGAVSSSSLEAFKQVLGKSEFKESNVTRTWRTAGDRGVRESHAEMEGQVVEGVDEPFVSGNGAEMMAPLDSSLGAGADDIINCRCDVEIEIDFAANLDEGGGVLGLEETPSPVKGEPNITNKVVVDGKEYKSVADAFRQLGLPLSKHQKFRADLKSDLEKTFTHEGKEYDFKLVPNRRQLDAEGNIVKPPPLERAPEPPPVEGEVYQPTSDRDLWVTRQEAINGFRENHGISIVEADHTGSSVTGPSQLYFVEKVKDIDRAYTEMKQDHPGIIGREHLSGGVYVGTSGDRFLDFERGGKTANANGLYYPGLSRMTLAPGLTNEANTTRFENEPLTSPKRWVVGTSSVSDVFRHEFGHALEYNFKGPGSSSNRALKDHAPAQAYWWGKMAKDESFKHPSRYSKTNGQELFAESVSAWFNPRYKAGDLPKVIEDYFRVAFKTRRRP